MSKRRDKQFESSAILNNLTYYDFYTILKEIAVSRFIYYNVPSTIDTEFIEETLFNFGYISLFHDEIIGDLALQCCSIGNKDVYNKPIKWRVYSANGYTKECDKSNAVIMYGNRTHTRARDLCIKYAKKLYLADRTQDINVNAQKTPIIIKASQTQRLTMLNLYQKYDGNQPYIFADKNLDLKDVDVLDTNAPYVADKLQEHKIAIWNECMTYLGIANLSINKKERLITDEVLRSQGGTLACREGALYSRKTALEYYNNLYGLNIDVKFNPIYESGD